MITGHELIADRFFSFDVVAGSHRLRIGASSWLLEKVDLLAPAPGLSASRFRREDLSLPGSLVATAGRTSSWRATQVACGVDVVIIGTKSWLFAEMAIRAGTDDSVAAPNTFGELLRPDDGIRPAWGSAILPAARFEEAVVPPEARLAVLDGASAVGWLNDLTTDFAVAIIDRSVADDFAAESVVQLRSMGSTPVLLDGLGWRSVPGIEALAFEARR